MILQTQCLINKIALLFQFAMIQATGIVEESTDIVVRHLQHLHINSCMISMKLHNVPADGLCLRVLEALVMIPVMLAVDDRRHSVDVVAPPHCSRLSTHHLRHDINTA